MVFLTSDGDALAVDTKKLRSLGESIAKYGAGSLWEPDDELQAREPKLFSAATVGDQWQLQISGSSQTPVTIRRAVVADPGCDTRVGFLAEVDPAHQTELDSASSPYFLISKDAVSASPGEKLPGIGPLEDWKATPELRLLIGQQLQKEMQTELASIREKAASEYVRSSAVDEAGQSWTEKWEGFDAKLARGEGKLDYDLQAFRLTPDGVPRLHARAKWALDGVTAFLMSAWFRSEPTLALQFSDTSESEHLRYYGFLGDLTNVDAMGTILNVFDPHRDSRGELLIFHQGWGGYDIGLFQYTDAGLTPSAVSFNVGCD